METTEHEDGVTEERDESMDETPMRQTAHVGVDALGYVSYMGSTEVPDSELAIIPEDFDTQYLPAYRIVEGVLTLDKKRKAE